MSDDDDDFQLKLHHKVFGGRAPPESFGELTALPRLPSWIWGVGFPNQEGKAGRGIKGMGEQEEKKGKGRDTHFCKHLAADDS